MGRSVYCRWCYTKGHNRRTCPEYTERLKEYAVNEVESNKQYDAEAQHNQREYADRIKADKLLDGTPHECIKQGSGAGERRCSYCGVKGHNRRTCEVFKTSKIDYITDTVTYRKEIAKTISAAGIGVGALMTIQPRGGSYDHLNRNFLYMVVGFEWDTVTHKTGRDGYRAVELKPLDVQEDGSPYRNEYIPFPKPASHVDDPDLEAYRQEYSNTDRYWDKIDIVSPVAAAGVKSLIPSDWYDGKGIERSVYFKEYFKDVRSPSYWDNYYDG